MMRVARRLSLLVGALLAAACATSEADGPAVATADAGGQVDCGAPSHCAPSPTPQCAHCTDAGDAALVDSPMATLDAMPDAHVSPCKDGIKDGTETDVDCGGLCDSCAASATCAEDSDCLSKGCDPTSHTCLADTCSDQRKDGDESAIDCGGRCASCPLGTACAINADCTSNACDGVSFVCVSDQCANHHREGLETDVDCGGGICPACARGATCKDDPDCTTQACDALSFLCVATYCFDHRQDGDESDVDCGGFQCDIGCGAGKKCNLNFDCRLGLLCSSALPHVCQ